MNRQVKRLKRKIKHLEQSLYKTTIARDKHIIENIRVLSYKIAVLQGGL